MRSLAILLACLIVCPTLLYAEPTTPLEAFEEIHPIGQFGVGPGFDANSCDTCHQEGGTAGAGPTYRSHHWTRTAGAQAVIQKFRFSQTPAADLNPTTPFHFLQVIPPNLRGVGLIDQIPEEQITVRHDPYDQDGDGISGRANGQCANFGAGPCTDVGRFGAKACEATLGEAIRAAFALAFGVTVEEQTTYAAHWDYRAELLEQLPELHALRPPHVSPGNEAKWQRGSEVFDEIGCADCHTSEPYTLPDGSEIVVYSDFLLHDLGRDANERIRLCGDVPSEWRTYPLALGRRFWFHDGVMNDSVRHDAIRRHAGEATEAANRWRSLLNTPDATALDVFLFSFSPIGGSS